MALIGDAIAISCSTARFGDCSVVFICRRIEEQFDSGQFFQLIAVDPGEVQRRLAPRHGRQSRSSACCYPSRTASASAQHWPKAREKTGIRAEVDRADINYREIAEYGSDGDPWAFNFDGELNIANRGRVEFFEVPMLDLGFFLFDLLGASQEHKIKPREWIMNTVPAFLSEREST